MPNFYMHIVFDVPEENLEDFKATYPLLVTDTRNEDGNVRFQFAKDMKSEEGVSRFCLYEEWVSQDALDAHAETEHFKKYFIGKIKTYWKFVSLKKAELI